MAPRVYRLDAQTCSSKVACWMRAGNGGTSDAKPTANTRVGGRGGYDQAHREHAGIGCLAAGVVPSPMPAPAPIRHRCHRAVALRPGRGRPRPDADHAVRRQAQGDREGGPTDDVAPRRLARAVRRAAGGARARPDVRRRDRGPRRARLAAAAGQPREHGDRLVPRRARGPVARGAARGGAAVRPPASRLRAARRGHGARAASPAGTRCTSPTSSASGPRWTGASSATGCSRRPRRSAGCRRWAASLCGRCPGPPAERTRPVARGAQAAQGLPAPGHRGDRGAAAARGRRPRGRGARCATSCGSPSNATRARSRSSTRSDRAAARPASPGARSPPDPAPTLAPDRPQPSRPPGETDGLRRRHRRRPPRARAPPDRHDRLADHRDARRPAADLPDLVPVGRRRGARLQRPAGEAQRRTSGPTRGSRCTSTTTAAATTSSSSRARRGSTSRRRPSPRTPPTSPSTASGSARC